DYNRVVDTLAAFVKAQIAGQQLPKAEWQHHDGNRTQVVEMKADQAPKAARGWLAKSPTLDFRKAEWKEVEARMNGNEAKVLVSLPGPGCQAFYGELEYEIDGLKFTPCTQIRVSGNPETKDK